MKYYIVTTFLLVCQWGICQFNKVTVEKRSCGSESGFKLFVLFRSDDSILTNNTFYDLKGLEALNDADKLEIVGKLLMFEGDTSNCCLRVSGYVNNYLGGGCKGSPKSKRYPI